MPVNVVSDCTIIYILYWLLKTQWGCLTWKPENNTSATWCCLFHYTSTQIWPQLVTNWTPNSSNTAVTKRQHHHYSVCTVLRINRHTQSLFCAPPAFLKTECNRNRHKPNTKFPPETRQWHHRMQPAERCHSHSHTGHKIMQIKWYKFVWGINTFSPAPFSKF
jgi:hypothetical protein